ncbi:MAG: hypothetical protein AB1638_06170 [Nitrospirota bacterium]
MDDLDRYNLMNRHISLAETYADVLSVIAKHALLGELRSISINYLLSEMEERIEAIKRLHKETHDRLEEQKRLAGVTG